MTTQLSQTLVMPCELRPACGQLLRVRSQPFDAEHAFKAQIHQTVCSSHVGQAVDVFGGAEVSSAARVGSCHGVWQREIAERAPRRCCQLAVGCRISKGKAAPPLPPLPSHLAEAQLLLDETRILFLDRSTRPTCKGGTYMNIV